MEQLGQRKHARLSTEYLALFSGERIRSQGQGVVLDLSVAGCRMRSPVEFTTGEYFGVVIDIPWYINPLDVPLAVVRWSKGQECGMEFIQMEPEDQRRLRELNLRDRSGQGSTTRHGDSMTPRGRAWPLLVSRRLFW